MLLLLLLLLMILILILLLLLHLLIFLFNGPFFQSHCRLSWSSSKRASWNCSRKSFYTPDVIRITQLNCLDCCIIVDTMLYRQHKTRKPSWRKRYAQQQCIYEGPWGRNLSSAGNPTLEPNITSISKPVAKLWPFLYIQDGHQPPSWISEIQKLHH